jgi:hypothetical protein
VQETAVTGARLVRGLVRGDGHSPEICTQQRVVFGVSGYSVAKPLVIALWHACPSVTHAAANVLGDVQGSTCVVADLTGDGGGCACTDRRAGLVTRTREGALSGDPLPVFARFPTRLGWLGRPPTWVGDLADGMTDDLSPAAGFPRGYGDIRGPGRKRLRRSKDRQMRH